IEGNKLALGTNLFSELPTIIEKYGQDYINEEVQKSSEYLDKILYLIFDYPHKHYTFKYFEV
ncbi:hypothetical protein, partial [Fusobacterium ulcerans]